MSKAWGLYVNEIAPKKSSIKTHPFHLTCNTSCRIISNSSMNIFLSLSFVGPFHFPVCVCSAFVSHSIIRSTLLPCIPKPCAKVFVFKAHDFCCSLRSVYPARTSVAIYEKTLSIYSSLISPIDAHCLLDSVFYFRLFHFTKECRHNLFCHCSFTWLFVWMRKWMWKWKRQQSQYHELSLSLLRYGIQSEKLVLVMISN